MDSQLIKTVLEKIAVEEGIDYSIVRNIMLAEFSAVRHELTKDIDILEDKQIRLAMLGTFKIHKLGIKRYYKQLEREKNG